MIVFVTVVSHLQLGSVGCVGLCPRLPLLFSSGRLGGPPVTENVLSINNP